MSEPSEAAIAANSAGVRLADQRRFAQAIPFYETARALSPRWYAPHLNLCIALKQTGDWSGCLAAAVRALELDPDRAGSGASWNAGVAATALGDWERARWAWTKVGITLPEGDGPIDLNIGTTPIRINCDEKPEVVWCHRIDPARARIESVPTPESGRRYHDVLLHDGEPRGKRKYGQTLLSVFDELAVLERSSFRTWSVNVVAPGADDLEALFRAVATESDAALEDWTASLELLCKQCSEGVPHEHGPAPERSWTPQRTIAVATRDDVVFPLFGRWANDQGNRSAAAPVLLTP